MRNAPACGTRPVSKLFSRTAARRTVFSFSSSDGTVSAESRFANITLNLVKDREQTSTEILTDVKDTLADVRIAEIRVGEPSGGPPVGAAGLIKFLGKDRTALNNTLVKAREVVERSPGASTV